MSYDASKLTHASRFSDLGKKTKKIQLFSTEIFLTRFWVPNHDKYWYVSPLGHYFVGESAPQVKNMVISSKMVSFRSSLDFFGRLLADFEGFFCHGATSNRFYSKKTAYTSLGSLARSIQNFMENFFDLWVFCSILNSF